MKQVLILCLLLCFAPLSRAEWVSPHDLKAEEEAPAALIPFPRKVTWQEGVLNPADTPNVLKGDAADEEMVRMAWKRIAPNRGIVCTLKLDKSISGEEAYHLEVTPQEVRIAASAPAGLFYGLQTLRQMLSNRKGTLRCCTIDDAPAFALRGFMHDCGRNFQTVKELKRQIDIAASLKLNTFQWHLTDHPAWHIQCKAYPVLNDPKFRTRDVNDTYSYDQIREVIAYARARHISIIPELDMPGHSSYFKRCFGFDMASEQGMEVLEKLLEEFCAEIPAEDCPIIHLGADEVRVPNAREFIARMSNKLIALGRSPMQWGGPRDLPIGEHSIAQRWAEGADSAEKSLAADSVHCRTVDSAIGYSNLFEPSMLVRRYFFMRPCGVEQGDELHLGVIACTWPDARVDDKSKIERHNGVWPVLAAAAERAWDGAPADGDALPNCMPAYDSPAGQAYALFEKRLAAWGHTLGKQTPFPFAPEYGVEWTVTAPVPTAQAEGRRAEVLGGKLGKDVYTRRGACLYLRTRPATAYIGLFPKTKPGVTAWAVTHVKAPKDGDYDFMIGFDAPARSSRRFSGVAPKGEWSNCGTRLWVNGKEIKNPQTYKLAGKNRCDGDTWFSPANENPFDDEEIWWAHQPTPLPLKKGENTIVVEQPYIGECQSWEINLVPLFKRRG